MTQFGSVCLAFLSTIYSVAALAEVKCPVQSELGFEISPTTSDVHYGKDSNGTYFFTWTLQLQETPLHVLRVFFDEPVSLHTSIDLSSGCSATTNYCALLLVDAVKLPGPGGVIVAPFALKPISGTATITAINRKDNHFRARFTASYWSFNDAVNDCKIDLPAFEVDLPIQIAD
ncbi:MAG: hypothetical protein M3Q07_00250 [Pseudobdellovibrionaceae bacterium]|nr:hypothetical protein [Pseudobdellovibrionaceae bacterium]